MVPPNTLTLPKPNLHLNPAQVYDATPFLEDHPGGAESILISAGMDATDEFNSIHSSKAKGMLKDYYIGELVTAEAKAAAGAIAITAVASSAPVPPSTPPQTESTELIALDPRKKIAFKLAEKIAISHNVRRFRFALQTPEHKVRARRVLCFCYKVLSIFQTYHDPQCHMISL